MILFAALALLPTLGEPVLLETRTTHGLFAVQAEVGGKKGTFLIGTSRAYSYVTAGFLKEGAADYVQAEVTLGGQNLGETYVGIDREGGLKEMNVDGVLGTDVLENCAIGFDYAFGKVSFWREGRLERKDAEAWMNGEGKVDRVRGWLENGALSVNLKFGGQEFLVGIAPDLPWTFLGPKASAAAKGMKLYTTMARSSSTGEPVGNVEARLTSAFSRGDLPPTYLEHIATPEGMEEGIGEGIMNPRDFNSPRIIFDLPGRCVWIPQVPAPFQATRALSRLFDIPLDLDFAEPRIGPMWVGYYPPSTLTKWTAWKGAKLGRFAGQDPVGLRAMLTPGKAAETMIASLYPQVRRGISVEVALEGKEGAIKTDPLQMPGE
jgi:hypothetical protein